jgi:regulator of CtrA degradation
MQARVPEDAAAGLRVARVDPLYREALALAEAARDYIGAGALAEDADAGLRLAVACETTRLVSRVGFCMAWLLGRRAVLSGEVAPEAADGACWRLGGRNICLAEPPSAALPRALAELLARSDRLYRRIDRLDSQLGPSPPAIASRDPAA